MRIEGTINPQFMIKHQGKDFCTYPGLLEMAHLNGLVSISTQLIQVPTDENKNTAIVTAAVKLIGAQGDQEGTFTGLGDANSTNVGTMIAKHIIRMAETRAKARALRDAVAVGTTAFEELGGPEEAAPEKKGTTDLNEPAGEGQYNTIKTAAEMLTREFKAKIDFDTAKVLTHGQANHRIKVLREKYAALKSLHDADKKPSATQLRVQEADFSTV